MNDKQLQQAVIDELAWEPSVTSEHIGVTAREGIITLSGHVPSYWEKRAAETAATRVKGVKAVAEEIEVKLFGGNIWEDDKIAERGLQHLASDGSVPNDKIKLTVEKGWVTLTGEVDWNYQKTAAEYSVHRLTGVRCNQRDQDQAARPSFRSSRKDRKDAQPRRILRGAGSFDQHRRRRGYLGGKLDNWYERDLAETAAWSVPGVTHVQEISLTW